MLVSNPITAAREVAPRDGLAGAVGLGVMVPDQDVLDGDNRWPRGYHLEGPSCGAVDTASADDCAPGDPREFVRRWSVGPDSAAFLLRSGIECSTFGLTDALPVWQGEVRRLLELCQWQQIAHELWEGTQVRQNPSASNRYLASNDAVDLTPGGGVGIVEAVALIEDAVGSCSCGDVTVIHQARRMTPYLASKGLVSSVVGQTARLFTHNGSLVVADRGYTGAGPGLEAADETGSWIYGTSVLSARLGPIRHPHPSLGETMGLHAAENLVQVEAERPAAISWLCCHFAARVLYAESA